MQVFKNRIRDNLSTKLTFSDIKLQLSRSYNLLIKLWSVKHTSHCIHPILSYYSRSTAGEIWGYGKGEHEGCEAWWQTFGRALCWSRGRDNLMDRGLSSLRGAQIPATWPQFQSDNDGFSHERLVEYFTCFAFNPNSSLLFLLQFKRDKKSKCFYCYFILYSINFSVALKTDTCKIWWCFE